MALDPKVAEVLRQGVDALNISSAVAERASAIVAQHEKTAAAVKVAVDKAADAIIANGLISPEKRAALVERLGRDHGTALELVTQLFDVAKREKEAMQKAAADASAQRPLGRAEKAGSADSSAPAPFRFRGQRNPNIAMESFAQNAGLS